MRIARLLLPLALLMALLLVAFFVQATCVPSDTGTAGNDTIICDTANPPVADVQGQGGDDVIVIGSGVVIAGAAVSGENVGGVSESGNDTIINNGNVQNITGDSFSGNGG